MLITQRILPSHAGYLPLHMGHRKGCQKIQVFINETILMEMSILNQTQVVKSKSLSPQGM